LKPAVRQKKGIASLKTASLIWPGVPLALLAAVLFGASTPAAKILLGGIDSWMLAGLLYLGSGLGLGLFELTRRALGRPQAEAHIGARDLPWLAAVVISGGVAAPVLLMVGLSHSSAAGASLLLNLEGLATMLIAWLFFHEHVDRRILAGALAILLGAALLRWQGAAPSGVESVPTLGLLGIAGACLGWGIDNNLTRKLSFSDPVHLTLIKGLVAGSVNLGLARLAGAGWPDAAHVLGALLVGLLGYGVSLVCFTLALRHLGTARSAAYFSTAPFIGSLIAVGLLHEPAPGFFWLAAALMGFGVAMHLIESHAHEHVHEPVFHTHRHRHDAHHQHAHGPDDPPGEPHVHAHQHGPLKHSHPHMPDLHHRHRHG
jgi:drug/metabolite transporter (DMT)-like permease